jgi:acyl-ACP thioesterase
MLERKVQFTVARMDIDALRLISAAERVSFHVTCTSASKLLSRYVFRAEARHEELVAAVIEFEVYI